jgi:hypothetical protein
LWPSAGEETLADAARTADQEIAPLADEVAAGELEEESAIKAAGSPIIDILNACVVAQPCGPGASLKALLPAKRYLVFEQQTEPFGVFERARIGDLFEFLEALRHPVEAKVV